MSAANLVVVLEISEAAWRRGRFFYCKISGFDCGLQDEHE